MPTAVVAFTERDRERLEEVGGSPRTVRIPVGVKLPLRALDTIGADPPTVLFVGNMIHPPNVEAAIESALQVLLPLT